MFHRWLQIWFQWTLEWGYMGVFIMMAVESTIFPLPSEIVIPPAAFHAAQGKMSFWIVVLMGTLGSYAGSALSYLVSRRAGRYVILRYGKYFLVPEAKFILAENWLKRYSAGGIFFARLLPVIRHLISIPAGILRVPFGLFTGMTLGGSFLWCTVLAWFGQKIIGDRPDLLHDPNALIQVCKEKLSWLVAAVIILAILYIIVQRFKGENGSQEAVKSSQ